MTNIEMIHELSGVEIELRNKVHSQTGENSLAALRELNRTRELIKKYAVAILDENEGKYQQALSDLGDVMNGLRQAQADIQKVARAIERTAQVLSLVEEVAKAAA
jgi:hypothetical protein